MRNSLLALLIGVFALALPLAAQDEPPSDAADEAADEPAAEPAPAEDEASDEEAADEAEEDDRDFEDFVPSEEVPPDEQVVFPVDI